MGACFSHQKKKKGAYLSKKEKFSVVLCGDVLLDVLQFGNRRQLVKLERVGRRLHWMVENFYGGRPFLRLGLDLNHSGKLEAIIIGNTTTKVSVANLTSVPRYIRFDEVKLFYNGQKSIEEKCRAIGNYLQPLEEALKDSNSIRFYGCIERNDFTKFSDHSKLLDYLSEHLLKICNSSRGYKFFICFHFEEVGAGTNAINSIIQMPQICRCSNLYFDLCCIPQHVLLPADVISSWLNRSIGDGVNFVGRTPTPKEIFLQIYAVSIQNVVEMCDHLAETFKAAKAPTLPYTFQLGYLTGADIEEQTFQNTKTNEELSIHNAGEFREIVIKRVAKKKKN